MIARNGRPAAKLVPIDTALSGKRIGVAKGLFVVPDNISAHNDDVACLFTWAGCSPELAAGYACCPVGHHGQSEFAPEKARDMIQSPRTTVWVSAANVWETAIKHALGRGDMPVSSQDAVRYFQGSDYQLLPIEAEHAVAVEELPAHHQDLFDRIFVAQALVEPMRLMTHDPLVALYSDTIIKV
ncbi:MAG TPA: type II toxin-antitoxin system VapC family toxin [Acidithiobacillus sp.]|nr:type II toxin-antitoxin system VapC family toxin [Acidithiobacillus sp.]